MRNKNKKYLNLFALRKVLKTQACLIAAGFFLLCLLAAPVAKADNLQQQINTLNSENAQSQSNLSALQLQASSYQDAVDQLQTQINSIQTAVTSNQDKQEEIQQDITNDNAKLAQEKQILSADIKAMYVDGQMSTIEELATSKNLSDFVDEETYRNAVETEVQTTLTQISQLENQLKDQQVQVQQLLQTEQAQQSQLVSDQSQQQQLLSYNQAQQAQYNQQIQANNSQINQLKAEQAAINAQYALSVNVSPSNGSGGACDIGQGNGGYPSSWCNAPQDSIVTLPGDDEGDNRECTSFAYWYFTTQDPYGSASLRVTGDAGDWWSTANGSGIYVDQTPAVGAIGVEPRNAAPHYSPFGHVMIVLALPGTTYDGSFPHTTNAKGVSVPAGDILVMSMNENEEGDFMYNLWPADTLYYIH